METQVQVKETELTKCPRCKRYLPHDLFYKNRSKKNGLSSFCKECSLQSVAEYQAKHHEKLPPCNQCGGKRVNYGNMSDGICGKCRHKEKMRLKANEPEQRKRRKERQEERALRNRIVAENLAKIKREGKLTKGEMLVLTRFSEEKRRLDSWSLNSRLFWNELARLEELELLKREQEDYILTKKGLEFLNNWHESQA